MLPRTVLLLLLSACGETPEVTRISGGDDAAPHPHAMGGGPASPHPMPGATASQNPGPPGGTVKETMDSGGYTYALLDACGSETWVAGPEVALAVGDTVRIEGMMRMDGFRSPKLDRTFDQILFTRAMAVTSEPIDCSAMASVPGTDAPANPHAGAATGASASGGAREGRVLETMESAGYRYARVDFCGTEAWVAGPAVPLEVGQTVSASTGTAMRDFHSASLDRTFPAIDFVTRLSVGTAEPRCAP